MAESNVKAKAVVGVGHVVTVVAVDGVAIQPSLELLQYDSVPKGTVAQPKSFL